LVQASREASPYRLGISLPLFNISEQTIDTQKVIVMKKVSNLKKPKPEFIEKLTRVAK
jgi:hypothetical protein